MSQTGKSRLQWKQKKEPHLRIAIFSLFNNVKTSIWYFCESISLGQWNNFMFVKFLFITLIQDSRPHFFFFICQSWFRWMLAIKVSSFGDFDRCHKSFKSEFSLNSFKIQQSHVWQTYRKLLGTKNSPF